MTAPSETYIVSKTEWAVTRRCPFCDSLISDLPGRDINFIVHLGGATAKHRDRKAWADYITLMNRA